MIRILPESIQLLRISDEEYFSEKYADYISNSKLKLINPLEGGSEELFETGLKPTISESFELGSAVHSMLLQPNDFYISDLRKPSGKLGIFAQHVKKYILEGLSPEEAYNKASISADYYSKNFSKTRLNSAIEACSDFWEVIEEKSDKVPITLSQSMFEKYNSCISSLSNNRQIQNLLEGASNEYAILCEVEVNGIILKLKSKIDSFKIDFDQVILNDLKTTSKPINYFMGNNATLVDEEGNEYKKWIDGSFQKYHYFRQIAFYLFLLQAYLYREHKTVYEYKANMIVVETFPTYKCKVFPVSGKNIALGLDEFKKLLIKVAEWKKKK